MPKHYISGWGLLLWLFLPVWALAQHGAVSDGLDQLETGHNALAIDSFLDHLAANPDDGIAHYNLALAYHSAGEDSLALPHLIKAEMTLPETEQLLVLKGEILMGLEAYTLAEPVWKRCIELNFLSYRAYKNLGRCQQENGDHTAALQSLTQALKLNKGSAQAYYYRAVTEVALGDTVPALEDLNNALALSGQYSEALLLRGNLYYQNGYHSNALDDYNAYLQLNPDDDKALNNRGLARSHLADHRGATEDFTVAIEINPNNGNYYFHRATEFFVLGDKDRAIADLDEALKLATEPFDVLYLRGKLYYDLGEYDKAVEDLRAAHELKPEHRKLTDFLFKAKLTAFFSKYWLYLVLIAVLLFNGARLLQRHRKKRRSGL